MSQTPDPTPPNPWRLTDEEGRTVVLQADDALDRGQALVTTGVVFPVGLDLNRTDLAELWKAAQK